MSALGSLGGGGGPSSSASASSANYGSDTIYNGGGSDTVPLLVIAVIAVIAILFALRK